MQWSLATVALVPRGTTAHASSDERRRILEWAARTGFAGVEVSPHWLNLDAPQAELAAFRNEAAEFGLSISGINVNRCLFTRGPRAGNALAQMRRAIEAAAILESRLVTFSLSLPIERGRPLLRGSDADEGERQRAAEALRDLAAVAAENRASLSLELHDDGILDTAEFCLDMVRRIAVANVGVNPDLGNLIRGDAAADWERALQLLAPNANNWHVKNYRHGEPAPLWEGEIDYARAVAIMHAAGYRGWVSIESYFGDVLDIQQRCLDYLRQLADRAATGTSNSTQESVA